jgi:hypothetical protein
MSKARPTRAEIGAILESLLDANCPNGCGCIFCRTFDDGFKAGLEDARTTFQRMMDEMIRKIGA